MHLWSLIALSRPFMSFRVLIWFCLSFDRVLVISVKLHLIVCLSVVCRMNWSLEWARMKLGDGGRSMKEGRTKKERVEEEEKRVGVLKEGTARAVCLHRSSGDETRRLYFTAQIAIFHRSSTMCTARAVNLYRSSGEGRNTRQSWRFAPLERRWCTARAVASAQISINSIFVIFLRIFFYFWRDEP